MPRYEYRQLKPMPEAERAFSQWIERLDQQFTATRDYHPRSEIVRNALCQLYLGRDWQPAANDAPGTATLIHSFDPRNITLEPEYYGDVDPVRYN
ncbi:MAG TPA: acyltransferase, partial [Terriglobales bacterium]|nr:acyltransferase [Terriglobales bacterium]